MPILRINITDATIFCSPVICGGLPGAIPAQKLVVLGQLVSAPDLVPFPVAVLHHCRVLDKSYVPATLNKASE